MQRWWIPASAILLTACAIVQLPPETAPTDFTEPSATGTGTDVSAETDGEMEPEKHVIPPASVTGALLPERLLPSGILEIGDRDAPNAMLLVTEHRCRYCGDFLTEHVPSLRQQFIDTGMLRVDIAILPLKKYAGSAEGSAALLCAAAQGHGWPMHQLLFARPSMDRSSLLSYAREFKLDVDLFGTCLGDPATRALLEAQQAWLRSLNVAMVPTYFIDGTKYVGLPYGPDLEGQLREATQGP